MAEYEKKIMDANFRIGVVGAMGSGKSTLVDILAANIKGSVKIPELYEGNGYLKDFYDNPAGLSYGSQLWFLGTAVEQRASLDVNLKKTNLLEDPAVVSNKAFALAQYQMGWMSDYEIADYLHLYRMFEEMGTIKNCDFTVFLTASDRVLEQRVLERGRGFEKVTAKYLSALNQNVLTIAEQFGEKGIPCMTINTGETNFLQEGNRIFDGIVSTMMMHSLVLNK